MSIRFKFRSSLEFESVDLNGRSSISLGELRDVISRIKKLNSCRDFDLEFFDGESGREFDDVNVQIPSGATVIVRRVPAKNPAPLDAGENVIMQGPDPQTLSGLLEEFDNFGADVCSLPATFLSDTALELTKKDESIGKANIQEDLRTEYPEILSSEVKPDVTSGLELSQKGEPVGEESVEEPLEEISDQEYEAFLNTIMPIEMKCPICKTYLKEAVMIRCCQQSFCADCIRQVLLDQGRCPQCFSDRSEVGNLIPNLSLREAVRHFCIEPGTFMIRFGYGDSSGSNTSDAKSGIEAVDIPVDPHSPSATVQGSNEVVLTQDVGFPRANLHDEADSAERKRELVVETRGGAKKFVANVGCNKVIRTCYTCGSPYHLFRDYPIACGAYQNFQTGPGMIQGVIPGYASSYWNGALFPSIRPFPNVYTSPGMMLFQTSPFPMAPYGVSPFVPSTYNGFSPPGGFLGMKNMKHSEGDSAELPLSHRPGIQLTEDRRKLSKQTTSRARHSDAFTSSERRHFNEPKRSPQHRFRQDRESGGKHSEDLFGQRSHKYLLRKHVDSHAYSLEAKGERVSHSSGRDRASQPFERLDSSMELPPNSYDRYSEDICKRYHRNSKEHHDGIRGQFGSDTMHGVQAETDHDRRDASNRRKHPRGSTASKDVHGDRWQMDSSSDEDRKIDQGRHRGRRVH